MESVTVTVPLAQESLRIYLNPPPTSPGTTGYRVQWEDANGTVETEQAPVSHTLNIRIPAAKLRPGQYVLKLYEINRDGTEKRVSGGYYFTAKEK
jgi:hypothetical protein